MADNKNNIEDKLQGLEFEDIQPWNGERDTGYDVRMKWYRNFKRIRLMGYRLIDYINTQAKDLMISLNDVFLSKKNDDTAEGLISFLKGAKFGKFAPGLTGYGGYIDGKGQAELESLFLRTELIVPTITYNKIKYIGGEQWQSKGEGTIESVDEKVNTLHLKLEDGDGPMLAVGDLCKTIYKDEHGFRTAFFKITEVNDDGTVKYELKPGTTVHPTPNSNIAQFGNETDPNRQSSKYSTTTYTRYLTGVNSWEINESNIAMQLGDLSNLTINGESMAGYSAYLSNIYLSGIIKQIAPTIREEVEKNMPRFLGHWRTGLHVPLGCSVKMGRYLFTCKVKEGTDNPPMWTYITDKGERIYFDEDENGRYYVITGDFNSDEYDILSADGINGKDGDKGDKGDPADSSYTWVAYSDFSDGRNLTFTPSDTSQYMGIAVNKGQTQSKNPNDYQWIKVKGRDGNKGKDGINGTSVTFHGHWQTGKVIPFLGIVRMGGHSFICTLLQGTYNPPMWTYITDKGERIYFDEDEHGRYYVITGDYNDEYEILTSDGRDGKDGEKGDKGDQGEPGPMTSIPVEWTASDEYIGNEKFASVVFVKKNGSYQYYRARIDVPANTPVSNTKYWEPISSFTRVGIYDAFINHLFADEAFVRKLEATMVSAQRIETIGNGSHIVIENGLAQFFGKKGKNIEFGVDKNGMAVLSYYNDNGIKLYDLGPDGISKVPRTEESWSEGRYKLIGQTRQEAFDAAPAYKFSKYKGQPNDVLRQYISGSIAGVLDNPERHRKYYTNGGGLADDGYYIEVQDHWLQQPLMYNFLDGKPAYPDDMYPENPHFDLIDGKIAMQKIMRLKDGRAIEEGYYYYNID